MSALVESLVRIRAVWMRHVYIFIQSPARIIEVVFWPTVSMVIWGFVSKNFALSGASSLTVALTTMLGAVILWELVFRTQIGMSFAYLEEIWARNLGHLSVSPLRPFEWWISMMLFSATRALIGVGLASILAIFFYGLSLFDIGLPLFAFVLNLAMMGWWLGFLITAILMRAGPGAEGIAWMMTYTLAPFCAVYYPLSILPEWMQSVGQALPAAHVFEGLRTLSTTGSFSVQNFIAAFGLNLFYLLLSLGAVVIAFHDARKRGTLLQPGE